MKDKDGEQTPTDAELLDSLRESATDDEMYEILRALVTVAGHVTIRDLFACTASDVGEDVASAIAAAKGIGFLDLCNDQCCKESDDPLEDAVCQTKTGEYCARTKRSGIYLCTLASDKC